MLGRLFNNRSNEQLKPHYSSSTSSASSDTTTGFNENNTNGNTNGDAFNTTVNNTLHNHIPPPLNLSHSQFSDCSNFITEDSYSRTVLYGTPNHLNSTTLDLSKFRLFIIQDKGELIMKNNYKTFYDSCLDPHFKINPKSQNYEIFDILEIMFGNSIHHDFNQKQNIKIHNLENLQSILISKHFTVTMENKKKIKKFAIGIIIPIPLSSISTSILSNWSTITNYLSLFQNIFIENHLLRCNNYLDVTIFFKTFIKSLKHLINIPRLLPGLTQLDQGILTNWCFEVNNWIEVKDGAKLGFNGTKFLTTLLTIVQGVKRQLIDNSGDEFIRIVIMASNPMVAQKLIFILSGILPFHLNYKLNGDNLEIESKKSNINESPKPTGKPIKQTINTQINTNPIDNYDSSTSSKRLTPPTPSVIKNGWEIPKTPSKSIATPSFMTPSRSSVIQPAASMSNSNSMAYLSSSLSSSATSTFSSSLTRGYQYLQNWKNNNDPLVNSQSSSSSQSYKTPSPNNEYDDYPWSSNHTNLSSMLHSNYTTNGHGNNSHVNGNNGHVLAKANSSYDLTCGNLYSSVPKNFKKFSMPTTLNIDRNITTLFNIGDKVSSTQGKNFFKNQCYELMNNNVDYNYDYDNVKSVSILEIPFDDEDDANDSTDQDKDDLESNESGNNEDEYDQQTLPQLCGYVQEYIPDFQIQACPISQDLDSKIISSMKNNLDNYTQCKTVLVSLRAREIKEISLIRKNSIYKSNVRKLYQNSRPNLNYINKSRWDQIEKLSELVTKIFRNEFNNDLESKEIAKIGDFLKSL